MQRIPQWQDYYKESSLGQLWHLLQLGNWFKLNRTWEMAKVCVEISIPRIHLFTESPFSGLLRFYTIGLVDNKLMWVTQQRVLHQRCPWLQSTSLDNRCHQASLPGKEGCLPTVELRSLFHLGWHGENHEKGPAQRQPWEETRRGCVFLWILTRRHQRLHIQ